MLHHGAYAIVLSRRITGADGSFLGVVAGSIRFSYFHELFGRLNLGPDDTITVLRRDRTIIMRKPFDLDVIGKNLADRPSWNPANLQDGGSYAGSGPVDSIPRLYVRRSSTSPLFVVVGKPLDSILSLWRTRSDPDRRRHAGADLVRACRDAVPRARNRPPRARRGQARGTGDHRRAYRAAETGASSMPTSNTEWRRAIRQKTPIALLMIDADHFKSYNDTFGHQAGDQILVGIAICISDSVRRAGDCAARYGGEEFAVLLPGLSPANAVGVAETIRLKVLEWSDGPTVTTVSIGVASLTPAATMDWSVLVRAADKALYAAKASGRNQSVLASIPALSLAA